MFVNGHYKPQLSRLGKLPAGARAMSLHDALQANEPGVRPHLARQADVAADPFVALNTRLHPGRRLRLPAPRRDRGRPDPPAVRDGPAGGPPPSPTPRVLVVAEENAEAQIVETYAGDGSAAYLTNAVTEFVVAADARIDHCKVQQESTAASHVAATRVHLASRPSSSATRRPWAGC